jgi:diguanylate cyclase (GGDEF)-like protein
MHVARKMYHEITITNEGLRQVKKELSLDALTGAYNYKYFQYITTSKLEEKEPFSFIMIDLDKFKEINDLYGHVAGNKVLQDVTQFLMKQIGSEDLVFRFGGDEFCIIIKNIEDAEKIAERIYKGKDLCYSMYEEKKIEILFSAGVYKYYGREELSFQDLVKKADKVMYRAKKSGGNKIFHYEYNS